MADEAHITDGEDITSQPRNLHLRGIGSITPTSDSPGDSIPSGNRVQPSPSLQDNLQLMALPSTSHDKDDAAEINQPGESKTIPTFSSTEGTVPKSANLVARVGIAVGNPQMSHSKMSRSVDNIGQAVPISTSLGTVAPPTHFNGSMADGGGHVSQDDDYSVSIPNGLLLESARNNQSQHHNQDTSAQSPLTSLQHGEDSRLVDAGTRSQQHTAAATSLARFAPASEAHKKQTTGEKYVPARKSTQRSSNHNQHGPNSVVSTKNRNGKRSADYASETTKTVGASNSNQPGPIYESTPPSSLQRKRRKKFTESGQSSNTGQDLGQLAQETIEEKKHALEDMAEPLPQILPSQTSDAISDERVDYNGRDNAGPNRLSIQSVSSRILANYGQETSELHCETQPSTVISDTIQRMESSNTYIWPLHQLNTVPFVLNITERQMQGQHELAQEFELHDTQEEVRMHFVNYYMLPTPLPRQNQHEDAPRELGEHEIRPYSAMVKWNASSCFENEAESSLSFAAQESLLNDHSNIEQ